ncbi:MAG: MaoC family dehydratase [Gammaproteobacteria bacterium]|nr:MaoC family dehydratase [Gammaproteobacteria bacterium]
MDQTLSKTNSGNFYEDFEIGQTLAHATPRTITAGDVATYNALYGARFALQSSDEFARKIGLPRSPVDDLLVFHMVFGKTVPDVSLNAVANLGYANAVFKAPVYPGDTIHAVSQVTGLKPNSNGKTGVVYVDSIGYNQHGAQVLSYSRWVMVHRKHPGTPAGESVVPSLPAAAAVTDLEIPAEMDFAAYDYTAAGAKWRWADYTVGEKIDHVNGSTVEEAEHQLATRLYQNTAKVHFDQFAAQTTRFKRRLVYGGHIISVARGLSFNGLENGVKILAINAGAHSNPTFAGDTVYAYSEVLERFELPNRNDVGALRVRLVGLKDSTAEAFPLRDPDGRYAAQVVLDLDLTIALPR